ncbi:PalH-domain-containing protein [Metschnikowia bicuspidata var. bicuspidata NRRL YB-4993]|uniref:PalH-domain-containing protein n=1 Tax=Metschnikowia bicuspidata var. bicuspidata NRRL YB-4993 TaxID=869754 RepID=A0A1A0HGF1_9ASCO|nr:PalH-domain-containing protein [Metschnikowia bicuspidata var. bicuspidata NRRL YB-4993]OBA23244.1 PalH-domain-containing protein [Metschnikowia bicuspidata var. bicuspidata NRRL YB-4993]
MSAATYSNSSAAFMSNYSVYFLQQNAHMDINCLVYSLTSGLLRTQDYFSGSWLDNITNFLPAYYVTNCSVLEFWDQIASQNVSLSDIELWLGEFRKNPYNEADNGDSFVALLFTLVGLCVLGWMLLLLFLLLPKHKQKPVLTQLAVLFYLVYLTVLFSQVARITEAEYYADLLDMVKILSTIADLQYAVLLLVQTLLTQLAYLQLFLKMTKNRWKLANCALVSVLIVACLVTGAFFVPVTEDSFSYVTLPATSLAIALLALDTVFMAWFAVCLGYYTARGPATPPKQVAYSKKLLLLAILTWSFVVIYIVQTLLLATLWREDWLTNAWISYVPDLLAMYILTASWEWLHSIRHLELRLELVDMLGRRISLEDVMDFSNDDKVRRTALRGRFASLLDFFGRRRGAAVGDGTSSGSISTSASQNPGESLLGDVTRGMEMPEHQLADLGPGTPRQMSPSEDNSPVISGAAMESTGSGLPPAVFAEPTEGSSTAMQGAADQSAIENGDDELPPFRPHPGFSKDDYWDEK